VPDLHLDPEGLQLAAVALARAVDALDSAATPLEIEDVFELCAGGEHVRAECERVLLTAVRARAELAELLATVRYTAVAAEAADQAAAGRLCRWDEQQ